MSHLEKKVQKTLSRLDDQPKRKDKSDKEISQCHAFTKHKIDLNSNKKSKKVSYIEHNSSSKCD